MTRQHDRDTPISLQQADLASILASCSEPIILPSAHRERKHREQPFSDDDVLHAFRHGSIIDINEQRDPPTIIAVGPGETGTLFEVGFIVRQWLPQHYDIYIVHAMHARLGYEMRWLTMRYSRGDDYGTA